MAAADVFVDVRSDLRRIVAEFGALREDIGERAVMRALNRALDKVATETDREVRRIYAVKRSAVVKALRKRRATLNSPHARLIAEGVRLPLAAFSPRAVNPWNVRGRRHTRRGGGVSVVIKHGEPRKLVAGAFIARGSVWRRKGSERESARVLQSIAIPQAVANKAVTEALKRHARETFERNLIQQIRFATMRGA